MDLKDKLYQEKVNSMKQLDKIECLSLMNNVISRTNTSLIFIAVSLSSLFITVVGALQLSATIQYLSHYGLNAAHHVSSLAVLFFVGVLLALFFLISMSKITRSLEKSKKEIEQFVEERSR